MTRRPPSRARFAVSTVFFVNGVVLASWVPHVPAVNAHHGLRDGDLGIVLLSMAGAVLALPAAGWMVGRLGSRTMTAVAAVALCLALPLPVLSPTVALLCLTLALLGACNGTLVPSRAAEGPLRRVLARPTRALLGLGVLAFLALLAEGAMADWSAVYLRDTLRTGPAFAAAGFAAFSLAMAIGRLAGDGLASRFGPGRVLRASGATAALGLGAALGIGQPAAGVVGCGMVGLGIANIIPLLFSGAGRVQGVQAGTALAAVATTGYLGFLAGPPLIGLAADAVGLPSALGIVSGCCALVAVGAGAVGGRS